MIYSFLSFIITWILPNKKDRVRLRNFFRRLEARQRTVDIQNRYLNIVKNLRNKVKLKVLFLVSENSKWKAQTLYDAMAISEDFEPIIALTIADIQKHIPQEEKQKILDSNYKFFTDKGMNVVVAFDTTKNVGIDLRNFSPDVVFYQQPYGISKVQDIPIVSKYALTCYIPYYLSTIEDFALDCDRSFHHFLYRYYISNEALRDIYKNHLDSLKEYSENLVVVGHTILDYIRNYNCYEDKRYIIYAPHWSICDKRNFNDINSSTFDWNGKEILEYAKSHREFNWVFKPHPTLKFALKSIGTPESEIENYYKDWESFATCCYDSTYVELFKGSEVMITDCGSFLLEYFSLDKPLIHLYSSHTNNPRHTHLKDIYDSFYRVNNLDELYKTFEDIIVQKNDYKREKRQKALESHEFLKTCATENILADLRDIWKGSNP